MGKIGFLSEHAITSFSSMTGWGLVWKVRTGKDVNKFSFLV